MYYTWAASQGAAIFVPALYVASDGNDSNPGTITEPLQSITAAIAASSAGDTIGLKGGQEHYTGSQDTAQTVDRSLVAYGTGKATLDARQHLQSATWTPRAGTTNCWETTVTFRETTTNNGVLSNSWTYRLWFPGNVHGTWKVGGADIAANVTAVDAEAGSYTVYKSGSTVQDPRSDTNGTLYVFVVHMPDGSDPNTKDLSVSDRGLVWSFGNGNLIKDIILRGGAGKDFSHSSGYPFPTFQDTERYDCNQHGHVGPCRVLGTYKAVGNPPPGVAKTISAGRCDGGGLNIYSITDLSAYDISIGTLDVTNFSAALYGHGSGNLLYRNVDVEQITATNCGAVVQFDVINGTNRTPVITGTVTVGNVEATQAAYLINAGGTYIINGGHVEFSDDLDDVQQTVARFNGTADVVTLRNVTWRFQYAISVTWKNYLYNRVASLSHTTPILTLDGCTDLSAAGKKGCGARSAAYASTVDLSLINNTSVGNIMDQAAGTNYPAQWTMEAGTRSGMGDRTGPQIETALTGAGIPFTISGQTTIVNLADSVLSSPGWK